jgi:hypothetical protein
MQYTNEFKMIPAVACLQVDKGVEVGKLWCWLKSWWGLCD